MTKDLLIFVLPIVFSGYFLIKNKFIGCLFIVLGCFMGISDYTCHKLLGSNIDLFTLLRIDGDMIAMSPYVLKKLFFRILLLTLITILIILIKLDLVFLENVMRYFKLVYSSLKKFYSNVYDFVKKIEQINYKVKTIAVIPILIVVFNFTPTGNAWCKIIRDGAEYIKYSATSADELFQNLGAENKYVYDEKIEAKPGKNIVIIYCESLENGYFDSKLFSGVTPLMNKLIENGELFSYKNYENCVGSGWTIGALYSTQTSLPCFFGTDGNAIFNRVKDCKLVSYAKVLKSAGYNNLFLSSAKLDFAGTGNMMNMLGYDIKDFKQFNVPFSKTGWGVHDKDLFEQAKIEYDKLMKQQKPFNLTLSTVDTNCTKGVPDERLTNIVSKQFSMDKIEYSVNSLDYLINDFYQYIKKQPNFENTEIIILGDHPLMGNEDNTPAIKQLKKSKRNITLLSSKKSQIYEVNDKLRYYDIPNFVLDVAEVSNNAVFSKELFKNMSPKKVKNEGSLFTHLNLKLTN